MEINLNIIYHEFYVLYTVYVCVELLIEPAGRVFQNVMSICFFHYNYNRQEEIWPETFRAHVARENNKTQLISISIYSDAEKKNHGRMKFYWLVTQYLKLSTEWDRNVEISLFRLYWNFIDIDLHTVATYACNRFNRKNIDFIVCTHV